MKTVLYSNRKILLAIVIILLLGLLLRFIGIEWDQGFYLNPDERFLVMTATDLKWPSSLLNYLNPQTSPLNPYNNGVGFFVYGHWPLNLAKALATIFSQDSYANFYKIARPLVSLVDWSVILAVLLIAYRLFTKQPKRLQIAVFSGLSYAIMVFPLQQAHFFTSDSFVNAFFIWSLYFLVSAKNKLRPLIVSAFFFGLGLSSKINIVLALPLLLAIIFWQTPNRRQFFWGAGIFGIISYLTLRLADPYVFASANILNPLPDPRFIQNLKELNNFGKNIFFPPSIQWLNTNWTLPIKNIVYYGLGPGLTILLLVGLIRLYQIFETLPRLSKKIILSIIIWSLIFYLWQANQMGKTMRYFLFLYPLFALFIGLGLAALKKPGRALLLLPALLWLGAFVHIYTVPHSRIVASNWLNQNLPNNSVVVWEYWDDPLPLFQLPGKNLTLVPADFYAQDSLGKWRLLAKVLGKSDYLVLSSNRLWGSLPKVPELYPITSRYYSFLFENKLGYQKIMEFNSFPTLDLGFTKLVLNDATAEEAFTVYDHPQVMIFKRQQFSEKRFLKLLISKKSNL